MLFPWYAFLYSEDYSVLSPQECKRYTLLFSWPAASIFRSYVS